MNVILLLDNAPDYREDFLRYLGDRCKLTVVAHPCRLSNLKPPHIRKNYNYVELLHTKPASFFLKSQFQEVVDEVNPDLLCISLNLRFPLRILDFIKYRGKLPWLWWGQVFGQNTILNPIKLFLIKNSNGALVYTEQVEKKIDLKNVLSFNNSQHSKKDFVELPNSVSDKLKLIFVGRPQKRKKLELALELAARRSDVLIRLVGPGMKEYFCNIKVPENVELYPAAHGADLTKHFRWSNVVVNPGHAGLLVMNAATHNRPLLIDSESNHAPEIHLAKETEQFFVNFENENALDTLLNYLINNPKVVRDKGSDIHSVAKEKYTIEHMANKHIELFKRAINSFN